jgi:hypothetical protein
LVDVVVVTNLEVKRRTVELSLPTVTDVAAAHLEAIRQQLSGLGL